MRLRRGRRPAALPNEVEDQQLVQRLERGRLGDRGRGRRKALSDGIQSLQGNVIIGESSLVGFGGALAWIVAVIAAAVAYRRAGAPVLATVLIGLSLIVISHAPPIGPVGLACFAGAVLVLQRSQRAGAPRTAQADSLAAHV